MANFRVQGGAAFSCPATSAEANGTACRAAKSSPSLSVSLRQLQRLSCSRAILGIICTTLTALSLLLGQLGAAEFSIEQESSGDIAIHIDGELFTRYVTSDAETNKCYFWPVIGPDGIEMTRNFPMKDVEGEKQDHPHHRSICFGLQEAGGFNTWHERLTFTKNGKVNEAKLANMGKQVHKKVVTATAAGDTATLITHTENVCPEGKVYLTQTRQFDFHVAADGSRIIDATISLHGAHGGTEIVGKKDSGLSIRVAHSICVDAGEGGHIVNSAGDKDADAWGKRAPWVDFYGLVDGKQMGIAMLNHPSSFRYPTPWHVRTYGLFTANPFALKEVAGEDESGDITLAEGETITLKHRIILHEGNADAANIKAAWQTYSKTEG